MLSAEGEFPPENRLKVIRLVFRDVRFGVEVDLVLRQRVVEGVTEQGDFEIPGNGERLPERGGRIVIFGGIEAEISGAGGDGIHA